MSGGAPLAGRAILVVEDDYFIAESLRRGLQGRGAKILGPVASIEEAMQVLAEDSPLDAAVLDLNLRGEMAFGVADALRARRVPFVFATGYDKASIPKRFGDVALCEKPIEAATIGRTLGLEA